MSRINTNVSSLIAQRVLRKNNDSLNTSLERLSTGLRINKGADDGVFRGQPVLDAFGIVGQVVQVDKYTSMIILISDADRALLARQLLLERRDRRRIDRWCRSSRSCSCQSSSHPETT